MHCSGVPSSSDESLSIGQVARQFDLAPSAIRYYENEGLIEPPAWRSGKRVYDRSILDRLEIVELAKRAGFSIAEIRELLRGFARSVPPGDRWIALAQKKRRELAHRIEEAEQMSGVLDALTRCDCPTFEVCAQALRKSRER